MIVVRPLIELEDGHPVLEVMTGHEARGLELRQDAVDRREPDVLLRAEQRAVDVLGREVPSSAVLEYFENLQARQRHLQAGFAKILAFHDVLRLSGGGL